MAMIEFPTGAGAVGRTVFQKLRELKHLHEVAWGNDFLYKTPDEYTAEDKKKVDAATKNGKTTFRPMRSRAERGKALNAQRANSIADMAAVLAGNGRGNKIAAGESAETVPVTVSWANDQDKGFAEAWPENVTHSLLPETSYTSGEIEIAVAEEPVEGGAEKAAA